MPIDAATAIQIIQGAITQKTNELTVLTLALSFLQGTFHNDLTSLTTAQEEANTLAQELQMANAKILSLQTENDLLKPKFPNA